MSLSIQLTLLSFALSLVAMKPWLSACLKKGWVSRDVHKPGDRLCVSVGAIPPIGASIVALTIYSWLGEDPSIHYVMALSLYTAALGLFDDIAGLTNLEKVILAAVPFVFLPPQERIVLWFSLPPALFPAWSALIGTFAVNGVNILAGFNGLEAGYSSLVAVTLAVHGLLSGNIPLTTSCLVFMAAMLPFLFYNVFPARAFPGNAGTFYMGGFLAAAALLYTQEWVLLLMLAPHAFDFLLKALHWGRTSAKGRAFISSDGTLRPPPHPSLVGIILRLKPMTEPHLVAAVWALGVLLALSTFRLPPLIHSPA